MDIETYKRYLLQTVIEYPKPIKKKILGVLKSKDLITDGGQSLIGDLNNEAIDTDQCENSDILNFCISKSMRVLKEIENWEFIKNYKYSIPYEVIEFDKGRLDRALETQEARYFDIDDLSTFDFLSQEPRCPTIMENELFYMIKFSLQQNTYDPIEGTQLERKRSILMYILKTAKYADCRFDFISPYDAEGIYDISHYLYEINLFLASKLGIKLKYIHLDGLIEYVTKDKKLNIIAQDMRMADGSQATLTAALSDKGSEAYVLPFLGELKNLLDEYSEEANRAPIFYEALKKFIDDKILTSDLPWVTVKWENGTETKFTFNYKNKDFCLVQHYCSYSPADLGMERMNHVAEYIVRYREFLTTKQTAE